MFMLTMSKKFLQTNSWVCDKSFVRLRNMYNILHSCRLIEGFLNIRHASVKTC